MVTELEFKNFRALRDVRVPLGRLNVIVGPNASGKTSILEGLHILSRLGSKPIAELLRGRLEPTRLHARGATDDMRLELRGQCDPNHWRAWFMFDAANISLLAGGEWNNALDDSFSGPIRDAIRSAVLLHLDTSKLCAPSYSENLAVRVEFDGSNLAAVLADLKIEADADYREIVASLRAIVPSIRDLRLRKTPIRSEDWEPVRASVQSTINPNRTVEEELYRIVQTKLNGWQVLLDTASGTDLEATQASDGTLLCLGLLTVLIGPQRPNLVLIDDLDRGLHPRALAELVNQIRGIQERYPDLQVVASSHSPYLLDHLKAEEVLLTNLDGDGNVAVARLNEHPEFDRWKDEMSPGEFWSHVGEAWVSQKPDKRD